MIGYCVLDPDINKCPHYIRDEGGCGADHWECGFLQAFDKPKSGPKAEDRPKDPKWFEKYYQK